MNLLKYLWLWLKAEFRWRVLGFRYEVTYTDEAQNQLDALSEEERGEIMKAMEHLRRNPYRGSKLYEVEEE